MTRFLAPLAVIVLALAVVGAGKPARVEPAAGARGMVVSDQHLATAVGRDVLAAGGNAVDAAVAVGYALAVTQPCCGNLGGGGFLLLRTKDGKEAFLDFRERAPLRATPDMYLDDQGEVVPGKSLRGWLAVGVPGTVAGLERAREKWGTMSREALLAPAIRLAEEGFELLSGDIEILRLPFLDFASEPNVAEIFLKNGAPFERGDRLVQKNLAHTLRDMAEHGPDAFYRGRIAAALVAASAAHGGILSKKDLEEYSVEEREPVRCRYRGYQVSSSPPPSSGGTTLCEILNILEEYPLAESGFQSAQSVHYTVEAARRAYVDRNTRLGDPAFVKNPLGLLLSKEYAAQLRATIDPKKATPSSAVGSAPAPAEGSSTTHYSVVDGEGNAVAVTYTINAYFGAQVIAGDTGFFLNDEMDDFSAKPGAPNLYGLVEGPNNAIAPGKRPLSSMSPTIVSRDGKTFLVAGSPGGSRIITITLGVLQNVIDYGMNVQEAVDAPRIHHQWMPDTVFLEPGALTPSVRSQLEASGHELTDSERTWGAAECILVDPKTGELHGANDRRRPAGAALGLD